MPLKTTNRLHVLAPIALSELPPCEIRSSTTTLSVLAEVAFNKILQAVWSPGAGTDIGIWQSKCSANKCALRKLHLVATPATGIKYPQTADYGIDAKLLPFINARTSGYDKVLTGCQYRSANSSRKPIRTALATLSSTDFKQFLGEKTVHFFIILKWFGI